MAETQIVPEATTKLYKKHTKDHLLADRNWPTELWTNPWRNPSYKKAALILGAAALGGLVLGVALGELGGFFSQVHAAYHHFMEMSLSFVPTWASEALWILIKAVVILHIILINVLFLVWWERKVSAHIQSRLGPIFTGGWHGWLQTVADGVKLLLKEDAAPQARDSWLHPLAPAFVFFPILICFAPVPFGREMEAASLDIGVFYVFAFSGISVLGIVLAGWASANKYSLLGGLRSAAQLLSYELPRTFSLVPVIALAESLSLTKIVEAQSGYWFGFIPKWFIFYPVVGQIAFLIFLIASVAETNRVPFDIPEAESELVAGFHTEYSGMKFALFFLTEYAYVFLASALMATFFFGGGEAPSPFLQFIPSWVWFIGKTLFFIFCFLWFRWTFPRFRIDRLMDFNWKFLLPWSFINIVFVLPYLFQR